MSILNDFKIGTSHSVYVTHINNPHSFYVRPEDSEDIMDTIEKPGKPISNDNIMLGQRVIYQSTKLGKYVRGEICFINNENNSECDVHAIDYGCYDKSVLLEHVYSLSATAKPQNQCPPLAIHCQLHLCESKGETFSEKVIESMRFFISDQIVIATVMGKIHDKILVELRTADCPRDISTMLGLLHYTTLLKQVNTVHRMYNSSAAQTQSASGLILSHTAQYKHRLLKVGHKIHVRVQSGTSVSAFYVAQVNEYKKYSYRLPAFSAYCKNREMSDEEIIPGIHCAVKIHDSNTYERAIIKEILEPGSKAKLQLVDWGKEVISNFTSIKSVATEMYFNDPIVAIYCSTNMDQVWETNLPKFLFPGYEFLIVVIEVGNGFNSPHKVNLYPLNIT